MKQVALRARDVFRKLVFKSQRRRNDPLNFNYNHGAIKLVISSIIPPMIRCFNTLRDVCTVQTTQNVQKIMSKFMNFVNIFEITRNKRIHVSTNMASIGLVVQETGVGQHVGIFEVKLYLHVGKY